MKSKLVNGRKVRTQLTTSGSEKGAPARKEGEGEFVIILALT
jgi:hypothetical protein